LCAELMTIANMLQRPLVVVEKESKPGE
jgi:hypothetical protein